METNHRFLSLIVSLAFVECEAVAQRPPFDLPPDGPLAVLRLEMTANPHMNSAFEVTQVTRLSVDPRGNIFVLDGSDQTVRMFDPEGRPVRTFGRKGAGPGEFISASWIGVLRDSLWVIDRNNDRVTAFSLSNRGLRSFLIPSTGPTMKRVVAVVSEGYLVGAPGGQAPLGSRGNNGLSYLRINERGVTLQTVMTNLPEPRSLVFTAAPRNNPNNSWRRIAPQPFRHNPRWTTADGGTSVILATTVGEAGRESDRINLVKIGFRGDTIWKRQLRFASRTLDASAIRKLVDSLSRPTTLRGAVMIPNRRMIEDSLERPAIWPPVAGIVAGIDGTIWLKQVHSTTSRERYWRLSAQGVHEATVEMPAQFQLMSASRTHVWGWRPDADGLPRIERYRVGDRETAR